MRLGEILVGRGLVTPSTIYTALERQRQDGGRLGEILVEMGVMGEEQLASVMASIGSGTPRQPRNIADTGISEGQLMSLMLKFMLVESREAMSDLSQVMKLPFQVVNELMVKASQRKLVQAMGARAIGSFQDIRYALSQEGRVSAAEALRQSQYLGPAPVPLPMFQAQVQKQAIAEEFVPEDQLRKGLGGLVVPEHYIRKLLPAINAGKTILLFGPPGNGKTTFASRIAGLFRNVVYIPYAVEIGGYIMKVFDQTLHQPVVSEDDRGRLGTDREMGADAFDDRWVACRRPFGMVGGELTLDMLEMKFDPESKFYDAPLHVKALNGVFLVDDFGRQQVPPEAVLNRWIVPMESRVDFLRLHTGKAFSLPFDQILVFSTNIDPQDIMDPALLRRIAYKILLYGPEKHEYHRLFFKEAAARGLELSEEVFDFIVHTLSVRGNFGLAYFQAKFVCDQVSEICRAFSLPPILTRELALEALSNLYVQIERQGDEGEERAVTAAAA